MKTRHVDMLGNPIYEGNILAFARTYGSVSYLNIYRVTGETDTGKLKVTVGNGRKATLTHPQRGLVLNNLDLPQEVFSKANNLK